MPSGICFKYCKVIKFCETWRQPSYVCSFARTAAVVMWKGFCVALKCYDCDYYSYNDKVGQKNCDDTFVEHNISKVDCGGECQVTNVVLRLLTM